MPIIVFFGFGVLILGMSEIMSLIWFLLRLVDVHRGKTTFNVSKVIPVLHLIASAIVVWFFFEARSAIYGDYVLPLAVRLVNSRNFFIILNLTTPLYPLLAYLKKRKQRSITTTVE